MTASLLLELLSRLSRYSGLLTRPECSYTGQRTTRMSPAGEHRTLGKSTYFLAWSRFSTRFIILLVCHRWRVVAQEDSSLWIDIGIDDPYSAPLCFLFEYSKTSHLALSGWTWLPCLVLQGRLTTIHGQLSRIKCSHSTFSALSPLNVPASLSLGVAVRYLDL